MSYNSRRRLMIAPSPSKYIDPNKSAIARILTHTHLVMATASTKSKSLRALFAMGWLFLGRTHIDHTFQFCSRKVPKISSVGCIHPAFFWNRIDRWLYDVVCILHIFLCCFSLVPLFVSGTHRTTSPTCDLEDWSTFVGFACKYENWILPNPMLSIFIINFHHISMF